MNQGTGNTFEQSTAGHYSLDSSGNNGYHTISKKVSAKLRLNILKGRWTADTLDDRVMLRKFKESKLSPEKFLKTWK